MERGKTSITIGVPAAGGGMLGVFSGERDNGSCRLLLREEWKIGCLSSGIFLALCAALLFRAANKKIKPAFLPAAIAAECVMTAGYFLYESTVLGYGLAAAAAVPSNLIQAGAAVGLGSILFRLLRGVPVVKKLMAQRKPDTV